MFQCPEFRIGSAIVFLINKVGWVHGGLVTLDRSSFKTGRGRFQDRLALVDKYLVHQ